MSKPANTNNGTIMQREAGEKVPALNFSVGYFLCLQKNNFIREWMANGSASDSTDSDHETGVAKLTSVEEC